MRKILFLAITLIVSCQSQVSKPTVTAPPQDFDEIRNEIMQLVKEGKTPSFSVAVLQDGKIIWQEAYEQSNDTSAISILPDAQYPIASLTKSMSATVLLKLVEEGAISLDDPINKYLDNTVQYYSRKSSSIRELLNMTAGIPHGWMYFNPTNSYAPTSNDNLSKNYGMAVFPKGIYEYSNYSYGIVEAIIEKVTNKTYEQVLERELFGPLGMKNTFITPTSENSLSNINTINEVGPSSKFFPAAGAGVYSTLNDLISYARLHLNEMDETMLSYSTLDKLHYDKIYPSTITALGWGSIPLDDNQTWLVSNGSFPNSANSNLTIIPEKNIAVICLANRDFRSTADIMAIRITNTLVPGFADKAFAKMEAYESADGKELKLDSNKFDAWEGVMKFEKSESPIEFIYKTDSLFVSFDNGEWQSIKYATIDHQSIIRGNMTLPMRNPITTQVMESQGNINLLVSEKSLQGYFSARFKEEDVFDLALPFYIEANGKN